jgi:hypothetical protein
MLRIGNAESLVRAVMNRNSKNGETGSGLWCVELVPKRRRLDKKDAARVADLTKGIPDDPDEALLWMVQAVGGLADAREPKFARDRQRLVVFRVKKKAAERARKETDEFWTGKVRPVKVV